MGHGMMELWFATSVPRLWFRRWWSRLCKETTTLRPHINISQKVPSEQTESILGYIRDL